MVSCSSVVSCHRRSCRYLLRSRRPRELQVQRKAKPSTEPEEPCQFNSWPWVAIRVKLHIAERFRADCFGGDCRVNAVARDAELAAAASTCTQLLTPCRVQAPLSNVLHPRPRKTSPDQRHRVLPFAAWLSQESGAGILQFVWASGLPCQGRWQQVTPSHSVNNLLGTE